MWYLEFRSTSLLQSANLLVCLVYLAKTGTSWRWTFTEMAASFTISPSQFQMELPLAASCTHIRSTNEHLLPIVSDQWLIRVALNLSFQPMSNVCQLCPTNERRPELELSTNEHLCPIVYDTMILQRPRIIMGDAGFERGTSAQKN